MDVVKLNNVALYVLSGSSVNDFSAAATLLPGTKTKLKTDQVHAILVVPYQGTANPFAAFSIANTDMKTYKDLGFSYGQTMVGISLILCIVGVCAAQLALKDAVPDALEEEFRSKKIDKGYKANLQGYVKVGNVWDPDEEDQMAEAARARAPTAGRIPRM